MLYSITSAAEAYLSESVWQRSAGYGLPLGFYKDYHSDEWRATDCR